MGDRHRGIALSFPRRITALPAFAGPFDAYQLNADGCKVLFAEYPAGTEIDTHTHPTDNVGVITAGRLHLTMDGRTQSFGPGDWYRVPANRPHAARFDEATAEIEFWFETTATHAAADREKRV